jgi:hypothetical protein
VYKLPSIPVNSNSTLISLTNILALPELLLSRFSNFVATISLVSIFSVLKIYPKLPYPTFSIKVNLSAMIAPARKYYELVVYKSVVCFLFCRVIITNIKIIHNVPFSYKNQARFILQDGNTNNQSIQLKLPLMLLLLLLYLPLITPYLRVFILSMVNKLIYILL